ncbi:MAG: acyltransferase, partial [Hyphomicrobium sp.]|nr:acyltransferase [Hyphomicrobium sp.]
MGAERRALLAPGFLRDGFGESLVAAATSISNFYFWSESGYFAPAAETIPLLHTWSLAVEEQFYLLFPLMLMLVWRWRQAYVAHSLIALAILSFAISVWAARHTPDAAFYLLPSRAWELLVGSLLALAPARQRLPSWLRTAALNLGLAGISIAVLTFHTRMPFPGFAAALPVFACALIIWAGHASSASAPDGAPSRSLVVSLLALRPMVFVGLISYSLYLWHWPIIVFVRH